MRSASSCLEFYKSTVLVHAGKDDVRAHALFG